MHKVLVVPSKSLFLWGLSILLLTPQVGISSVGPRTFATVQELLWYNCSPVYGWSARRLYSGANGDLLLEDLCHRPQPPGLLQLEPLALWQVPDDPRLQGRTQTLKGRSGSVSCGVTAPFLGPSVLKVCPPSISGRSEI